MPGWERTQGALGTGSLCVVLGSILGSHLGMVAGLRPLGLADPVPKGHSLVQCPLHKPRSSPASVSGLWGGTLEELDERFERDTREVSRNGSYCSDCRCDSTLMVGNKRENPMAKVGETIQGCGA